MNNEKSFNGRVLFLDRADINTDEIIAAKYLTEISRAALGPHLFEDLEMDGFQGQEAIPDKNVIITRANFGCGSSREHAPWALEVNGIHLVVAESFARIFRQNVRREGEKRGKEPGSLRGFWPSLAAFHNLSIVRW